MTEPDSDFEFEFFDEPSTQETAVRERPLRRGPRPPMRPPRGITPLLRLAGLIAFAIVAVVVLVFVIQGCRSENKEGEYRGYMENVALVARESESHGRELNRLLTTPGIRQAELERRLNGLAQAEQQLVATADGFDAPGRLVEQQTALTEALQLRVSGLRGLEDGFRRTARTRDADAAGELLAGYARRLVASDIVWDDLFRAPARQELRREDVTGVRVPNSDFLPTPDLATSSSMEQVWQRLRGPRTGGTPSGLHGSALVSTTALPQGIQLSEDTEETIQATTDLAFEVTIENSGDFQEVSVEVELRIPRPEGQRPIVKTQTVDIIDPGEQQTVTFRDLGEPPIAEPTVVQVNIEPVAGETNTGNNTAEYPVIFSLA